MVKEGVVARYILSLDQGTTSSRAILFDHESKIIGSAQKEFRQYFPKSAWVEHDPHEIFASQVDVAMQCIISFGVSVQDIAALGVTNQRETTVVWNKKTGRSVYNAIVWQDRRTAQYCDQLKADGFAEMIRKKTGLLIDSYFSASKIKWILDNVDGAKQMAESGELLFGTIDTWLIWNFTKGASHCTDYSNASRTLLYNISEEKWDKELLELFEIPETMLPQVRSSSSEMGVVSSDFFGSALKIAGVAGDQQAATYGNACTEKGMAKNTYGTGCFMLMNTGSEVASSQSGLLSTIAWGKNSKLTYACEGSVFIGGAVVQWLRDGLEIIKKSSEIEALVESVDDNGGVYLVPAFAGLGAPHWDPYARGAIFGLTRGSTKAHIARAAVESIALQCTDIAEVMQRECGIKLSTLRVDGGASKNDMLMQLQADLLDTVVERPMIIETTALGAAYLAGLCVGFWESEEEISSMWKVEKRFEPNMSKEKRERLIYDWHRAVKRTAGWIEE